MEIIHKWKVEWVFRAEDHYPGRTEIFLCLGGQRHALLVLGGDRRPPLGEDFQVLLVVVPTGKEE